MTNEEKAQEIAGLCNGCLDERKNLTCQFDCINKGLYYGALKMAEWKGQQLKEYLFNKMKDCENDIHENSALGSMSDTGICMVRLNTIKDIIKELFGE